MISAKNGLSLLAVCVALAGCKSLLKKRLPVTEDSASPVASAAPAPTPPAPVASVTASAAPPVAANEEVEAAVPTAEDFEDEAFQKISAANFKAELTKLSKEVGK